MTKHWDKPEEGDQVMAGLYSIRECLTSKLFQLDNETESELVEVGAIEMDTEEMAMCLDDAISLLEKVRNL